jgi:hypothetical protein
MLNQRCVRWHSTKLSKPHRRVSWLGTFEGFLFASLGFAWDKSACLIFLIASVGFAVSFLVLIAILGSVLASWRIRKLWLDEKKKDPDAFSRLGVFGFYPEYAPWTVFISPEILLTIVFMLAWAGVFFIR